MSILTSTLNPFSIWRRGTKCLIIKYPTLALPIWGGLGWGNLGLGLKRGMSSTMINILIKPSLKIVSSYFKYSFLFCLLQLASTVVLAQQNKLDSLEEKLMNYENDNKKVDALNGLAYEYIFQKPSKAKDYAREAVSVAKKSKYKKGLAEAYKNLGSSNLVRGSHQIALEYYLQSLNLYEDIDDKSGQASLLSNTAVVYRYLENYPTALDFNFKALKLHESTKNQRGMAYTLDNIGEIYTLTKDYYKARKYYMQALEYAEKTKDIKAKAAILHGLGVVYSEAKIYNHALDHFQEALVIDRKNLDKKGIAENFLKIGEVHLRQKRYNDAKSFLEECLEVSKEIEAKDVEVDAYRLLAELYEATNKYKKSLNAFKHYAALEDSLINTQKKIEIAGIQEKNNQDRKDEKQKRKRIQLEDQIKLQYSIIIAAVIIIALVAVQTYIFFRISRRRKKINRTLRVQKNEITLKNAELAQKNEEIEAQRDDIERKNKQTTDSIRYAENIQAAMLPFKDELNVAFPKHFILYEPRDIVSGDFYWYSELFKKVPFDPTKLEDMANTEYHSPKLKMIAAVDCTGHGVPGAFMSMIGHNILDEIVKEKKVTSPEKVLSRLHNEVRRALKQAQSRNDDGMDITFCLIDENAQTLEYAGAKHPLVYIQEGELYEIRGDKKSIGGMQKESSRTFTKHTIKIDKPTSIYMFSDGYSDQLSYGKRKKFTRSRLKKLILEIHKEDMAVQKEILKQKIEEWRGKHRQVDDILVMGLKLD